LLYNYTIMHNNLVPNEEFKFICKCCDYKTCRKSQFDRHIMTLKHKNKENTTEKVLNEFICQCGKKYNYLSGLSRHRKSCKGEKKETAIIENEENVDYKSMFFEALNENKELRDALNELRDSLNENKELRKTITEMIPKMGNNNNNNLEQEFNINIFLDEKCKDALTMDEIIDKIEVSMKNLLTTKEKGQVEGKIHTFII